MPKLTVIIPCKNEELNIRACLESVKWADEIFVVDSGSTDRTLEIAREFTERVVSHEYINSATQKNWAIPQATHEWVMIIDCDEQATPTLQAEIQELLKTPPPLDGYRMARKNYFFRKEIKHCGWDSDAPLRLFKRDLGRYADKHVHADIMIDSARTGLLAGQLIHHTYRSFDQYLETFGRYTTWSALDLKERGRTASLIGLVGRPSWRFFRMYILRRGFLDGKAGLILCTLAAFNVWMRYAKLWLMQRVEAGEDGIDIGRTEW